MLNCVKSCSYLLILILLSACGYQTPNSDTFPHQHVQELNPEIKNLKMTYLDIPDISQLYSISYTSIIIDCSKDDVSLCLLDTKTHQLTRFKLDKNFQNHNIEELTQISANEYLILLKRHDPSSSTEHYIIFNKDTLKIQQLNEFDYDIQATKILDHFVQSGYYEKQQEEFEPIHYFNRQYIENIERQEKIQTQSQAEQSFFNILIEFIKLCIDHIQSNTANQNNDNASNDKSNTDLVPEWASVVPAEKFNQEMSKYLTEYFHENQVICFINTLDKSNLILKTHHSYIYTKNFSVIFNQNSKKIPISECKTKQYLLHPLDDLYKYQSIDGNHSGGNHFVFWFNPEGYDVFEITQHGQTKQFKLPIGQYSSYQTPNTLMIITPDTYYLIPTS